MPLMTLDGLLDHFAAPTVLKIDVEGAELDVLHGASHVLSDHRPAIYCEVAKRNQKAVAKVLRKDDYRLYDGSAYNGDQAGATSFCSHNTIAIPEERVTQTTTTPN